MHNNVDEGGDDENEGAPPLQDGSVEVKEEPKHSPHPQWQRLPLPQKRPHRRRAAKLQRTQVSRTPRHPRCPRQEAHPARPSSSRMHRGLRMQRRRPMPPRPRRPLWPRALIKPRCLQHRSCHPQKRRPRSRQPSELAGCLHDVLFPKLR